MGNQGSSSPGNVAIWREIMTFQKRNAQEILGNLWECDHLPGKFTLFPALVAIGEV